MWRWLDLSFIFYVLQGNTETTEHWDVDFYTIYFYLNIPHGRRAQWYVLHVNKQSCPPTALKQIPLEPLNTTPTVLNSSPSPTWVTVCFCHVSALSNCLAFQWAMDSTRAQTDVGPGCPVLRPLVVLTVPGGLWNVCPVQCGTCVGSQTAHLSQEP